MKLPFAAAGRKLIKVRLDQVGKKRTEGLSVIVGYLDLSIGVVDIRLRM